MIMYFKFLLLAVIVKALYIMTSENCTDGSQCFEASQINSSVQIALNDNSSTLINNNNNDICNGILDNDIRRPFRIVVSTTEKYFAVFVNWLVHYNNVCLSLESIYLICLDAAVEKLIPQYGLNCSHVLHVSVDGDNSKVWLARAKITQTLIKQGFDVLLSDSDAIWFKSPFPYIKKHIDSDIISSRASFPDEISEQFGATLCMGFIYVKASARINLMWDEFVIDMTRTVNPDDQKQVNVLLRRLGLIYSGLKPTYKDNTVANVGQFQFKNNSLSVTLLPHNLFRRMCDVDHPMEIFNESAVAHCLIHKKGATKTNSLEAMGMWALREDWSTHKVVSGNLSEFLISITKPHYFINSDGNNNSSSTSSVNITTALRQIQHHHHRGKHSRRSISKVKKTIQPKKPATTAVSIATSVTEATVVEGAAVVVGSVGEDNTNPPDPSSSSSIARSDGSSSSSANDSKSNIQKLLLQRQQLLQQQQQQQQKKRPNQKRPNRMGIKIKR